MEHKRDKQNLRKYNQAVTKRIKIANRMYEIEKEYEDGKSSEEELNAIIKKYNSAYKAEHDLWKRCPKISREKT